MIPKTDSETVKELARGAADLLGDRAFTTAVEVLKRQWYGELMIDTIDVPKVQELVAKLRALEAIPQLLSNLKAAPQFAQRGADVRRTG
jgi:hypothetical protein